MYPFPEEATGCVVQKKVLKIKSSEDLLFYLKETPTQVFSNKTSENF